MKSGVQLTQSSLYRLFIEQDSATWGRIVFTAVVAGLMQGAIIVVINSAAVALGGSELGLRYLLMFFLFLATFSWASHYSNSRTIALTERTIFDTYVVIADRLRRMQLLEFERLGKTRIYSTLYTNADIILEAAKSLANVGVACVLILFSVAYIAWLSPAACALVVLFYLFGYFIYRSNLINMRGLLKESERNEQRFKALFRYFLEGFKEIKVSHSMSRALFEEQIKPNAQKAKVARVSAERRLVANSVFIQSYYYFLVASVIFLLPRIGELNTFVILQVAVVVLFSYGSMTRIVQSVPLILKAERAVGVLHSLSEELLLAQDNSEPYTGRFARIRPEKLALRLEEATFSYQPDDKAPQFSLGPVSLVVDPGELLFVVGGNGSGKTTLLKLLAGLYPPVTGNLYLGDKRIDQSNYSDYRNLFAVLFSDYHLFERFYGQPDIDDARLTDALRTMGLEEQVVWEDGRFDDFNLSTGQRKRLALVFVLMKNSPILLMDEVTADLDPVFRRYFYEKFLPELKASGKTIIAVSHDERYFHIADHVIQLDAGRIAPRRNPL